MAVGGVGEERGGAEMVWLNLKGQAAQTGTTCQGSCKSESGRERLVAATG